jgi:hypothetical protein
MRIAALLPLLVCSKYHTLTAACPFQILVYYSVFLFFGFFWSGQGSVFPVGYAGLPQGWLWEYHISSLVGLHLQAVLELVSGGAGVLMVSQ